MATITFYEGVDDEEAPIRIEFDNPPFSFGKAYVNYLNIHGIIHGIAMKVIFSEEISEEFARLLIERLKGGVTVFEEINYK